MSDSAKYRPFNTAAAFLVWYDRNCDGCKKCLSNWESYCDIENAFQLTAMSGGRLVDPIIGDEDNAKSIAARLGWDGIGPLPKRCPEFQPTEEQ